MPPVESSKRGLSPPTEVKNEPIDSNGNDNEVGEDEQDDVVLDRILFRKDPDDDTMGYKAVLEAFTNPQSYLTFRHALRTTLFVSFPLFTLGVHPNTMFKVGFICMLIATVLGTSCCRATLGEHIGLHTWVLRGILYMYIFSELGIATDIHRHPAHWWGIIAAGIFLASFTSDANIRRFMYLYFFVFMMECRQYTLFIPELPTNNGRWLTADLLMGVGLGVAANLLPYPTTLASIVDILSVKLFTGVGTAVQMMNKMVWSEDVHAASIFFNDKTLFDRVEYYLGVTPTLLWFTNWEPLEFTLRNYIRRFKFSFLRRILSLVYAAFSVGSTLVFLKREQQDRVALMKIRQVMWEKAFGVSFCPPKGNNGSEGDEGKAGKQKKKNTVEERIFYRHLVRQYGKEMADEIHDEMWENRSRSKENSENLGAKVLEAVIAIAKAPCTPACILKEVDFRGVKKTDTEMRRHLRQEILFTMQQQKKMVQKRRAEAASAAAASNEKEVRYETIVEYQNLIDDGEVFIRLNSILFHMLISMIAGEVVAFGEQMSSYKPELSLKTRLWRFFIVEPWYDFWDEVWCHLTLARPADWRILKDAIKVTCAYMSSCALNFETYVVEGEMYYFGTTILLGLPVEEESLSLSVNRLAGNCLGCAVGFLTYNNFHSLESQLGMSLFLMFILQLFKNHPLFGQTFFYAAIMVVGGVATSLVPIDLLTRLLFSSYTICAYLLCFMLIFPTNPMKILFGYRAKLSKLMSEIIDLSTITTQCSTMTAGEGGNPDPFSSGPEPFASDDADETPFGRRNPPHPRNGANGVLTSPILSSPLSSFPNTALCDSPSSILCSVLSDHLLLARKVIGMCTKWTPFASHQHVIRGMLPFPEAASLQLHHSFLRLMAQLDLLAFGSQLLNRPRPKDSPFRPALIRLIRGALHEFLTAFSNSSRVLFQDIIDSMQQSRKWDSEIFFRRCGRLSKLKVVAHAVMYEYYVLMAEDMTKAQSLPPPRSRAPFGVSKNNSSIKKSSEKEFGALNDSGFEEYRKEVRQAQKEGGVVLHLTKVPTLPTNTGVQGPFMRNGYDSNTSTNDNNNRRRVAEMPFPSSAPSKPSRVFHFSAPFTHFPMNANATSRFESKDPEEARLDEEMNAFQNSFVSLVSAAPSPVEGVSRQESSGTWLPHRSQRWKREHSNVFTEERVRRGADEDGSHPNTHLQEKPIESWLNFTFFDDSTHLPRDTDLLAVSAIVGGCEGFIVEMEHACGWIKTMSEYQRQLHESSLVLPWIDRLSAKAKRYVESVYLTRHYNLPLADMNFNMSGSQHLQNDLYAEWYF